MSHARTDSSWRIPAVPLLRSLLRTALVALLLMLAAARTGQQWLGLSAAYHLKATSLFLAALVVAAGHAGGHHPFTRFGPANAITTVRLAIAALLLALVGEPVTSTLSLSAAGAALVGVTLDGADGWTARRSGLASPFGARFDMETDAVIVMALSLLAWRWHKAGAWFLLAGLLRYLWIAASSVAPWLAEELPPWFQRKAICVVQILGSIVLISPALSPPSSTWLAAALLVLLTYSFAADAVWLWQRRA